MLGIATFLIPAYIVGMNREDYRARRQQLGLTQEQFSELLGVGRDTVIAREAGKSRLINEHELALEALEAKASSTA